MKMQLTATLMLVACAGFAQEHAKKHDPYPTLGGGPLPGIALKHFVAVGVANYAALGNTGVADLPEVPDNLSCFNSNVGPYYINSGTYVDGAVNTGLFAGPGSLMATGGMDLVFYCGHGGPWGPYISTSSYETVMFPSNYYWGNGCKYFVAQSCELLYDGRKASTIGNPTNWLPWNMSDPLAQYSLHRWDQAMGNAQGKMHAIFNYLSEAWICKRGKYWAGTGWETMACTDLAPAAFANGTMNNPYASGPQWFQGSINQHSYFSGDPGEIPAVLCVENVKGDYFNEILRGARSDMPVQFPDPSVVKDPGGHLVLHYQVIGTPASSF